MVKCKVGGSQAGIGGKLLHVGFSLNGEMLGAFCTSKPKNYFTLQRKRNKGREAAMNFHHVGRGFLDV